MQQISGLSEVRDKYDHFFIDVWGVIYDGVRLAPDMVGTFQKMEEAGKSWAFVSNTPRVPSFLEKIFTAVDAPEKIYKDRLLTAGGSTRKSLLERLDEPCYIMARHEAGGLLDGLTLNTVDSPEKASYMLNSIATGNQEYMTYFSKVMETGLERDIPMVCANPDLEVVHDGTLYTCAGHFAQLYEDNGGTVEWHGKPYTPIYEWGWELLGKPEKSRICMIGDSLRTDVTGAKNFGIDCIWNLDGTTAHLSAEEAEAKAAEKGLHPAHIMRGFSW